MRIEQLTLKNVRLFGNDEQTLQFDKDKNITILLGNNGYGKSTILDTLSVLLSPFVGSFPGNSLKNFKDTDIHIKENNQMADYLCASLKIMEGANHYTVARYRKGMMNPPQSEVKDIKSYAEKLKKLVAQGEKVNLPILAYYGTGRGQIKAPERKRGFQKVFAQWDCYDSSLEASTDFKRFFAWYDMMEDEERRERERRRDFNYHLRMLQVVRRAIEQFVDQKYKNPHIDIHPLRFVLDEYVNGVKKRELRLEQFSDGYKIIIAMVADIASRMAEGNPGLDNPLEASGIILIDEIDLHLHPRWQREILRKFQEVFPHVQFIVTTHSPIILQGASDIAQVVILDGVSFRSCKDDFENYDICQILLSELFGLESVQAPIYDHDIKEQEELLKRYGHLSKDEQERLNTLDDKLKGLSYSASLDDLRMQEYIYKIAHRLNIE